MLHSECFKARQERHGVWMRDNLSEDMEKSHNGCSIVSGKDGWAWLGKRRRALWLDWDMVGTEDTGLSILATTFLAYWAP